jgi:hypothetical protein
LPRRPSEVTINTTDDSASNKPERRSRDTAASAAADDSSVARPMRSSRCCACAAAASEISTGVPPERVKASSDCSVLVLPAIEYWSVTPSHCLRASPVARARDRRAYGSTACRRGKRAMRPVCSRCCQPRKMPHSRSPRAVGTTMSLGTPQLSRISCAMGL